MANALLAMGLVLIYMSNRVINLAHGEFGAFAVAMMLALTRRAHLNYCVALARDARRDGCARRDDRARHPAPAVQAARG